MYAVCVFVKKKSRKLASYMQKSSVLPHGLFFVTCQCREWYNLALFLRSLADLADYLVQILWVLSNAFKKTKK